MVERQKNKKENKKTRRKRRNDDGKNLEREKPEFEERVVHVSRNSKVVKGGRRFSFGALVVVGNYKGQVGYGLGKAAEVADAIRKAGENAKRNLETVTMRGTTLPHDTKGKHSGAQVLIRTASEGTGVIAGGACRAVLELAGIRDVLAKSLGSNNHLKVTKATLKALSELRTKEAALASRKN